MLQLDVTRERMLADIGVRKDELGAVLLDPGDPAFLQREQAHMVLRGHDRKDLFARLERPLRRRFHRVTSEHLDRDLLTPLKNALGNAQHRGNREDLTKWLTAEVAVTACGAVVAVADEGSGFDVERVLHQFAGGERYFTRGGHGTKCFARTRSLISYVDGGRTWLLRFDCHPQPGEPLSEGEGTALGPAGDPAFMRGFLASRVPCFRNVALESCRVHDVSPTHGARELAYVLACRTRRRSPQPMVVTGRLLSEPAARADVTTAGRLREAGVGARDGLRVPRPLGAFREPGLSLFHLDPSATFRELAKSLTERGPLARILRLIAIGLSAIHLSTVSVEAEESLGEILDRQRNARARVEEKLARRDGRERASACFGRLLERSGDLAPCEPVPIHGALEWDCIVGSRERWELYRFERSRRSYPGLDVGAFLADLLRFQVLRPDGNPRLYRAGRAAFLASYFGDRRAAWSRDLDWFVASALLERLERMLRREEREWAPKVGPLLEQIERVLPA